MSRAFSPLRPVAALFAVLLVIGFGVVAPAGAATTSTGKGNGNDQSSSAVADKDADSKADKGQQDSQGGESKAADHKTKGTAGTSGDATKPQPLSKADQNTGGANGQCTGGTYCSTRDGSPSMNGNGGGESTGKPCAGCVGKADNKNPKGQMPDPKHDGNNGYECDDNNGIGKGNPAHTGCQAGEEPPTTPEDTCPDGSMPNDDGTCDVPVPTCPDGSMPNDAGECEAPLPTCPDGTMPGDDGTCANGEEPICPDGSMPNDDGTCDAPVPTCPDGSMPNEDGTCDTGTPGTNRPPTVAGVEQFAGPQPPAGVEQYAGPGAGAAAPNGILGVLPATGAGTLMNALAATGLGLLLLGAATLLVRRRSAQGAQG